MNIRFGPAGSSDSFAAQGYKKTAQMPEYLEKMGLNAFEYQCGRGVRIPTPAAQELGREAEKRNIALSVHAPYFISLSSLEAEKREKSIDYILQTARAAKDMGATRIVVHSGSCAKLSRQEALVLAKETLSRAQQAMDQQGYGEIHLCPETMGKVNQLGTLQEVLELCQLDERMIPCIDFGHLNARTFGQVNSYEAFRQLLEQVENTLGRQRAQTFHAHFSKIQYTQPGGEKCHLTFEDTIYGPEFAPLAQLLVERDASPVIICESAGTQAEDAQTMFQLVRTQPGYQEG